jgi:adenine-specific DNA-methyltransferase
MHRIPNLQKHFKRFKPLLINRNIRTGSISVKEYVEFVEGKRDVPYVMIKSAFKSGNYFCISYARTESVFVGEKIICPQFSPLNTFGFHNGKWFAASDVYFIKKRRDRNLSLKYLLGLLSSKLYYFWLYHKGQRKGRNLQLFRDPLSEIPIMNPHPTVENTVARLVDSILAVKFGTNSDNFSRLEREIDQVVYNLYKLSEEEISVVENAFHNAHADK